MVPKRKQILWSDWLDKIVNISLAGRKLAGRHLMAVSYIFYYIYVYYNKMTTNKFAFDSSDIMDPVLTVTTIFESKKICNVSFNIRTGMYTDAFGSHNIDHGFVNILREALLYFKTVEDDRLIKALANHRPDFYRTTYLNTSVYTSIDQLPYSSNILKTMALFGSMCGLYKYVDCDMYDYPDSQDDIYYAYSDSKIKFGSNLKLYTRKTIQYLALIPGIIISPIILGISLLAVKK
jgi:hypothetical protein